MERIALLPIENLSGDPALDSPGAVISAMAAGQASASTQVYPFQASGLGAARLNGARKALQGYLTKSGGRIRIHAVVEDLASGRMSQTLDLEAGSAADLPAAALSIAQSIGGQTRPFGTKNAAAIQAWGEALVATERDAKIRALERAIAADADFGSAYTDLATVYLAQGDGAGAARVLHEASGHMGRFTDLERARFQYLEAGLRNNPAARRDALLALANLVPGDIDTLRTLAGMEANGRRFPAAIELLRKALVMEPANPTLLNELGYAEAYNGNLDDARAALERYRDAQPGEPNPLDSLGEVHFFAGRFAEAEKYFLQGQRAAPMFQGAVEMLKAAQARYLAGNLNGADEIYTEYEHVHRNDPLNGIRRAQWFYMTGRPAKAIEAAQAAAGAANSEIAAYAACHLSLWAMDAGDKAKAAEYAAKASQARSPAIQRLAALCRGIAGMPPVDPTVAQLAQAYAALFAKQPETALPVLAQLYPQTQPPIDGDIRTLYAWALAASGRHNEAKELLERYYIPMGAQDEAMLTTHAFAHFQALRGGKP